MSTSSAGFDFTDLIFDGAIPKKIFKQECHEGPGTLIWPVSRQNGNLREGEESKSLLVKWNENVKKSELFISHPWEVHRHLCKKIVFLQIKKSIMQSPSNVSDKSNEKNQNKAR